MLNKPKILLIAPLLILAPLLGITTVHGINTPAVCINTSSATDCNTAASFESTSFTVGSQLTVNVNVQGAPSINAFNVEVLTDFSLLHAHSVSAGNVLTGGVVDTLVLCEDKVLLQGNTCSDTDGLGVVHLAQALEGASTPASTTGILFSITYDIVGQGGPATIGFQTSSTGSCSGTSFPNTCVTLAAAGSAASIASLVSAPFSNANDFSLAVNPSSTSVAPSTTGTSSVNLAALGLFSDTVNLVATPSAGLTASLGASSFALSNGGTASTTLMYSSAAAGSYTVDVSGTAMSGGQTHDVLVSVLVHVPDFAISADTSSLTVAPGSSATSTITISSISGFTGTVGLTSAVTPSGMGVTSSLDTASIPNSAGTSLLHVSASASAVAGTYDVAVTGSATSSVQTIHIAVSVPAPDFDVSATPGTEDQPVGVSASAVITVTSLNNFAGPVTLTATVAGSGTVGPATPLTATLAPSSGTLTAGSQFTSTVNVPNPTTSSLGNYTITITGTSGPLSHQTTVLFVLLDFSETISKTSFLTYPGAACTPVCQVGFRDQAFLTADSLGGFTGFGFSSQGNSPVGPNCIRFIVSFVAATLQCIDFDVFFANGTQATQSQVLHGLVPFITLPRFQFPIPDNSPLCFSFGLNDTNDHCDGSDTGFVRVRSFPFTIPGSYTFNVHAGFSVLDHFACGGPLPRCTILVPSAPTLAQLQFKPHLSLSKNGNAQSFKVGITNPNTATSESVIVHIDGLASDHTTTFHLVSTVQVLAAGQTINNIILTAPLTTAQIGLTFTITVSLQWGVAPHALTARANPDVSGFPNSGSFTVFT